MAIRIRARTATPIYYILCGLAYFNRGTTLLGRLMSFPASADGPSSVIQIAIEQFFRFGNEFSPTALGIIECAPGKHGVCK
jgi:hypothetical protein